MASTSTEVNFPVPSPISVLHSFVVVVSLTKSVSSTALGSAPTLVGYVLGRVTAGIFLRTLNSYFGT